MNRKDRRFGIGTIVRHFKGKLYRIEGFARHTETNEMMVFYRQMYPPFYSYVRPEADFCSKVDRDRHPEAAQEYRFERVTKKEAMGSGE